MSLHSAKIYCDFAELKNFSRTGERGGSQHGPKVVLFTLGEECGGAFATVIASNKK